MKKILLLLTAVILLQSCTNDDDTATDNLKSTIQIDGEDFKLSEATSFFYNSNDPELYSRRIHLIDNNPVDSLKNYISLQLIYPKSRPSATGRYTNHMLEEGQTQLVGHGLLVFGTGGTLMFSGAAINVTDYGNDKFKIEFENMNLVAIPQNGGNFSIPITGTFEGKLTTVNE